MHRTEPYLALWINDRLEARELGGASNVINSLFSRTCRKYITEAEKAELAAVVQEFVMEFSPFTAAWQQPSNLLSQPRQGLPGAVADGALLGGGECDVGHTLGPCDYVLHAEKLQELAAR